MTEPAVFGPFDSMDLRPNLWRRILLSFCKTQVSVDGGWVLEYKQLGRKVYIQRVRKEEGK